MNDFGLYFTTGWQHIISLDALDHLLFIAALAAIYLLKNWKAVLILVTAFTIGHSITLALSVYQLVKVSDRWVEFLIPCTIVATGIFNLLAKDYSKKALQFNYLLALVFGLIHGLGFANTIRFMLAKDDSIGVPLLGFNLGLEAGQIVVVLIILSLAQIVVNQMKVSQKWWVNGISLACILVAGWIALNRLPW